MPTAARSWIRQQCTSGLCSWLEVTAFDWITLVGADAEYPETDYGWIEPRVVVSNATVGPLSPVSRFWEKPSLQQAHALLRRCLWNTFVTVGRAATFFEKLCSQAYDPERHA
jgi:mannose-1-phosphate guanylyltransferase